MVHLHLPAAAHRGYHRVVGVHDLWRLDATAQAALVRIGGRRSRMAEEGDLSC
jgi:hypothetical protein